MVTAPATSKTTRLIGLAATAAAYIVSGKLSLQLGLVHPSASAVWPPSGIALAAALLLGPAAWPVILGSAFVVNVTTAGTPLMAVAIATGNTLEAVVGATLVRRWAGGLLAFNRTRNVLRYILLAGAASTAISATVGTATVTLAGSARWADFGPIWVTWWMGDMGGALVVAPLLLLWSVMPPARESAIRLVDSAALGFALGMVGLIVFGPPITPAIGTYPLEFLAIPVLLWVAFRFGARATATTTALLAAMALTGTLFGFGPFALDSANQSLLLLQSYAVVLAGMGLVVAAAVAERRRAETHLRELAVTDPLTGLANYRHLMQVLEREIRRSQRSNRMFALLFLDMNDLKEINDRFGHLKGSQALYRLALVLRHTCRTVDTPARFGGDEFAIVMPEADEAAAHQLAQRIEHQLAAQSERPPITVSTGVALFGRDGESAEALLHYADDRLYSVKRARRAG